LYSNYLLAHRKLTWIPTNGTAVTNVTGKVKIQSLTDRFFGRTLVNNFYMLGRTFGGNFYYQMDAKNFTKKNDSFEVLTCSP
jgi:hypothetical protein